MFLSKMDCSLHLFLSIGMTIAPKCISPLKVSFGSMQHLCPVLVTTYILILYLYDKIKEKRCHATILYLDTTKPRDQSLSLFVP